MKRFKVVAIHPETGGCQLSCSFCYKKKELTGKEKPREFWYRLIPYIAKLTNQVAVGSNGEPFMDSAFVARFANLGKKSGLIVNVTSNGRKLMEMNDELLKDTLKDITMISLSFDSEKVKTKEEFKNYINLVQRIKKLTKCQVGCNLLIDNDMFKNKGLPLIALVKFLFKYVHRVFILYPKSSYFVPINDYKYVYYYLTKKYKHFYCDDASKMVLEQGYSNWVKPCHFAKDLISISETGAVCGCSFDSDDKALLKLERPEDLLKIKDIKPESRFNCPYLNIPEELKGGKR